MKFNATVHLGRSSYPPGKPVPLGGKGGISEEEADILIQNFGHWNPEDNKGSTVDAEDAFSGITADLEKARREAARVSDLEADIARRIGELDKSQRDVMVLQTTVDKLEGELLTRPTIEAFNAEKELREQAEDDAGALAEEVRKLTEAGVTKDTRIAQLEADLEEAKKNAPAK